MSGTSTNGRNPITAMDPVLINPDGGGCYVNVILGSAPEADDLLAGAEFLAREFVDSRAKVTPQIKPGGYVYQICFPNYHTDVEIAAVEKLIKPKYSAQATATATVKRNAAEVHTSTVVKLQINAGTPANVEAAEISEMDGVLRARWLGASRDTLSFTVSVPTEENVQRVTNEVAERLGVYVSRPVVITDANHDAALDPDKDHKAVRPAAKAALAGQAS